MPDPWEGELPIFNTKLIEKQIEDLAISMPNVKKIKSIHKDVKPSVYLNCWHESEYESAAMWDIYSKDQTGIAICATVKEIRDSFEENREQQLFMGRIKYIDYDNDAVDASNLLHAFLRKRKSFSFENEVRLIYWNLEAFDPKNKENNYENVPPGIDIKVNIDKLIKRIYIYPTSPIWIHDAIKSVIEKFSINPEIIQSNLMTGPK
jgi:hypothetical protein